MRAKRVLLLSLILLASFASRAEPLHIATASNFRPTLEKILRHYHADTGARCIISSAATGTLYAQIVNGAGYDILLAADSWRPALLIEAGLARRDSLQTYAYGALALASRVALPTDASAAAVAALLLQDRNSRIALANPDTAPYGQAARHVLQQMAVWESTRHRRVTASNVGQALQFFSTGNVRFAFVGYAQWRNWAQRDHYSVWLAPTELYPPLQQDAVILSRSSQPEAARDFLAWLHGATAVRLLTADGYRPGPAS